MSKSTQTFTIKQLLLFFLPLGMSASLVSISHVVINSTLTRADNAVVVVAGYAVAASLFNMTERPVVVLRQTCTALVRDRQSFRAMSAITLYLIAGILALSFIIAFTPIGKWIFTHLFGVEADVFGPTIDTYRILMFVSVFSALRCLYHGIIIQKLRTKWLTIGMVIRLISMYGLSVYFIQMNQVSGTTGALIFLVGMSIEALISIWEGRKLLKHFPQKKKDHHVTRKSHIFHFYRPLMLASFLSVTIIPTVNAFLSHTGNASLAIASFALAFNLTQLVTSFFSYTHQIVLNFYRTDSAKVLKFCFGICVVPAIVIGVFSYTPVGAWFLDVVMGAKGELLEATLYNLRIFMLFALVFPWVDFCNGMLMLNDRTKVMVRSQTTNVTVTALTLMLCIWLVPEWNGRIGALSQSIGIMGELIIALSAVIHLFKRGKYDQGQGLTV